MRSRSLIPLALLTLAVPAALAFEPLQTEVSPATPEVAPRTALSVSAQPDAPSAPAAEDTPGGALPRFKVSCEQGGAHDPENHDVFPASVELSTIVPLLNSCYPRLSRDLKLVASQVPFVINHSNRVVTKSMGGWSAEDDQEYRFPCRTYGGNGCIKVSLTEVDIQLLQLELRASEGKPEAREAMERQACVTIAHELTHAKQFHDHPVHDLARNPAACSRPGQVGLCDPDSIRDTWMKIRYEHEAFETDKLAGDARGAHLLRDAILEYARKHPEEFGPGHLFTFFKVPKGGGAAPPKGSALSRQLATLGNKIEITWEDLKVHGREFRGEQTKVLYYSEVIPPELAWKIHDLNLHLKNAGASPDERAQARQDLKKLDREWVKYMPQGGLNLREVWTYLPTVEKRYCQERAEILARIGAEPSQESGEACRPGP